MKKHLIAAAVAAAVAVPAMAQNVTMYGVLSSGYQSQETEATSAGTSVTTKATTTGRQGAQGGNRVGFRGTEDLGGGLKASFVYELAADLTSGLAANRLGYMDLSGGFGTVRVGRIDGVIRQIQNAYTASGNAGFNPGNIANNYSVFGATTLGGRPASAQAFADIGDWGQAGADGSGGGRISNSIGYISNNIAGFTAQVYMGQVKSDRNDRDGKGTTQDIQGVGLRYDQGPLSVLIGAERAEAQTDAAAPASSVKTEFDADSIGASYNFGFATAFLAWTDRERTVSNVAGSIKSDDLTVGVRVPFGATTLIASYSDGKMKATGAADYDVSGYHLGVDYALSKRTKLYAQYGDSEAKQSGGNSVKIDGFGFGVYHNF